MKKTLLVFASAFFLLFSGVTSAVATLIVDNGIIKDDRGTVAAVDDYYWIQDLNRFVGMTYDEQIAAISNLENQGLAYITDWHMATYSDILTIWDSYGLDELTGAFTPTTDNGDGHIDGLSLDYKHWVGRYDRVLDVGNSNSYHYEVNMGTVLSGDGLSIVGLNGGINVGTADHETFPGAFVVAYHKPDFQTPVPEPATMLLFGTGIAGIVGSRLCRKKK